MKKLMLIVCLVCATLVVNADEIGGNTPSSNASSKLEQIQVKIDKYTKVINNMPIELQNKINNFDRLKGLGYKVQKVLTKYIIIADECVKEAHSPLGEEVCNDISSLDLGSEIRNEKKRVLEMVNEAERELKEVRAKEKDLPIVKKALDSLVITKKMLMREGY